jgi:hypothetical protein
MLFRTDLIPWLNSGLLRSSDRVRAVVTLSRFVGLNKKELNPPSQTWRKSGDSPQLVFRGVLSLTEIPITLPAGDGLVAEPRGAVKNFKDGAAVGLPARTIPTIRIDAECPARLLPAHGKRRAGVLFIRPPKRMWRLDKRVKARTRHLPNHVYPNQAGNL